MTTLTSHSVIKIYALSALLVFGSCSGQSNPSIAELPTDVADTNMDSEIGTETDAAQGDTSTSGDGHQVDTEDGEITEPVDYDVSCTSVSTAPVRNVALKSAMERWFLFYTETSDYAAPMLVQQALLGTLQFNEPSTVIYGAKQVDLAAVENGYLAIAARQYYSVLLTSQDGMNWEELENIAPDEPTYACQDFPPVLFGKNASSVPETIAMGNDLNTGIFGCVPRLFFSKMEQDAWQTPQKIGDGNVSYVWQGVEAITVVSDFGVYVSTDEGNAFAEIEGGDTTNSQIKGNDAAYFGGNLYVVQSYNWANEYHIAILQSEDDGISWKKRSVLNKGPQFMVSPQIEGDQNMLSVAWYEGASLWLMTSRDRGATWAPPANITELTQFEETGDGIIVQSGDIIGVSFSTQSGLLFCEISMNSDSP